MSGIRRNPNFERELLAQPGFQAGLRAITTAATASVREAAPRKTGQYRKQVTARGTRVHVDPSFWHLIEFGSINNPPYAPLRRGLAQAGLRFVDLSSV